MEQVLWQVAGYKLCGADPDDWMKPTVNKEDSTYMLVYVNDCLAVNHDLGKIMEDRKSCYKLKGDTYGGQKDI